MSCAAACGRPAAVLVIAADLIAPTCADCAVVVILSGTEGVRIRTIRAQDRPAARGA